MLHSSTFLTLVVAAFLCGSMSEARLRNRADERIFTLRKTESDENLCAMSEPSKIVKVRSEKECVQRARYFDCTQQFNYIQHTQECHLYFHTPAKFEQLPGCIHYAAQEDLQRDGDDCRILVLQNINTLTPVAFNQNWDNYQAGFGDITINYWIGLDQLNNLTNSGCYKLRVEMSLANFSVYYVEYQTFIVDDVCNKYQATFQNFIAGNIDNGLAHNDGMFFSTFDHDNDNYAAGSCSKANTQNAAWWFDGSNGKTVPCSFAYPTNQGNTYFKWGTYTLTRLSMYLVCL